MSSLSSPISSASPTTSTPSPTDASALSDPNIASANYFFGFVVTFVVLLLLFVGCGVGSWRRFQIIGTAWDARLQGVDDGPIHGRKRGRRKLVRPVFRETWVYPKLPTNTPSQGASWEGIQPISAAFLWSRSRKAVQRYKSEATSSPRRQSSRRNTPSSASSSGFCTQLLSCLNLRHRPRSDHSPKPPVERPPPDAVQVAVMISMPSPSSSTYYQAKCESLAHVARQSSVVGEYQIGVMQLPWPSNDAS